ncbi:MAG: oxidative damage protection protein [Candidatus Tectimicrobiota bacterium]
MAQHMVFCAKLQRQAPGIDTDDIQGEVALDMIESVGGPALRQRIYENVSMEAWELWKGHLTMLMNEYRLNTMDPQVDPFIQQQMENFFFGENAAPPPGYVPPHDHGHGHDHGHHH